MRPRTDFYTLCPQCETKVTLTLASKLQSSRAGCSCTCPACKNEWVCIQEWIYRTQLLPYPQAIPAGQQPTLHGPSSIPRPHMPVGAPVMAPAAETTSVVPQPHAWKWERHQQRAAAGTDWYGKEDGSYSSSGS